MELEGFDELIAKFNKLGAKAKEVEKKAIGAGAEVLKEEISKKAPRGERDKELSRMRMKHTNGEHMSDNIVVSKVMEDLSGEKFVRVGPDKRFFYANFVEHGTGGGTIKTKYIKLKDGKRKKLNVNIKIPPLKARPFVEPAYLSKKNEMLDAMIEVVNKELELE